LIPRGVRPIRAEAVAQAMVEALHTRGPGVHLLTSAQLQQERH
jgi:hypothetical protein